MKTSLFIVIILVLCTCPPGMAQDGGEYYPGEQEILDQIEEEDAAEAEDTESTETGEEYFFYTSPLTEPECDDDYQENLVTDSEVTREESGSGFDTPGAMFVLPEDFENVDVDAPGTVPEVPAPTPVEEEGE